jgi:hypothetical protein
MASIMVSSAKYSSQHRAVSRARGLAIGYRCVSCKGKATQWAWIHDMDRDNVMSYMPMCMPCHQSYDHSIVKHDELREERRFNRRVEMAMYYIRIEYPRWVTRTRIVNRAFSNKIRAVEMDEIMDNLLQNGKVECRQISRGASILGREFRLRKD